MYKQFHLRLLPFTIHICFLIFFKIYSMQQIIHIYVVDDEVSSFFSLGLMKIMYEGESLNNRNFIIPFLQEYLQKLFVPYFST
jgi:hypothetical protein